MTVSPNLKVPLSWTGCDWTIGKLLQRVPMRQPQRASRAEPRFHYPGSGGAHLVSTKRVESRMRSTGRREDTKGDRTFPRLLPNITSHLLVFLFKFSRR